MTTYKSYAECKIAHPDSEIVTTGENWIYDKELIGTFQPRVTEGCSHTINDYSWVICNPADYCSSLKEFFDAGFELVIGDWVVTLNGTADNVRSVSAMNGRVFNDCKRYILSAAALNGGCKTPKSCGNEKSYNIKELQRKFVKIGTHECDEFINACSILGLTWSDKSAAHSVPHTARFIGISLIYESGNILGHSSKDYWIRHGFSPFKTKLVKGNQQHKKCNKWTVYNNTLPLFELSDEQAAMLFSAWRKNNEILEFFVENWSNVKPKQISINGVYRIKQKSERELFIEAAVSTFDGRTGLSKQAMSLAAQTMFDSGKFKRVIKDGE